jgi:uncharacterized membrane protein YedE/YeeE
MKRLVASFVAGVVFAVGLTVAGMTRPGKVLAFLDVFGRWDPSLAFVMVGAIGVAALAFRLSARRASPLLGGRFVVADARAAIEVRVVVGAAIFGVGWGLSGLCPGPAVASLASGQVGALVFVGSMIVGMAIQRRFPRHAAPVSASSGG